MLPNHVILVERSTGPISLENSIISYLVTLSLAFVVVREMNYRDVSAFQVVSSNDERTIVNIF